MEIAVSFFVEPEASQILERLREYLGGHRLDSYLVGGFVRDGLLGRANQDIDLAVAGPALDIARVVADAWGGSYVVMDERNQVARVILPGRKCYLDFSAMRGSLEQDLALRDFTINAIAMALDRVESGWAVVEVIDPLDGIGDLERRLVRAIRDSVFQEDPIRLLRAVRLASQLDFAIEANTEGLIRREHALISGEAGERVRDELCRLLALPRAAHFLRRLDGLGLLDSIVPELTAAKGVTQPKEHRWDVFQHSIETVAGVEQVLRLVPSDDRLLASVPWSRELADHFQGEISGGRNRVVLLKLAALLHDIAKPQTRSFEPDGRMRFLGHSQQGAEVVGEIMERLRFSRREIKLVTSVVEHHLRPGQLAGDGVPSRRAMYRYFRDTAEAGIDTLFLSLADHLAARGPELDPEEWQEHARITGEIIDWHLGEQHCAAPPRLIDGHDIMRRFGLRPGPKIGELLEALREAQAAGEVTSGDQALELVGKKLDDSEGDS